MKHIEQCYLSTTARATKIQPRENEISCFKYLANSGTRMTKN